MKIVRLSAENIKKLRAVEIAPDGEIVTISGRNGQGKTSVLDSIWWALTGTKHIQGEPIRKGETKARIRLDLGEIVVERRFTPTGSTLAVDSAEGARFQSPQKMLDALIGELSFDPLAFARMEPRKQFDELRRVSKLEVDIDKLNGQNAADYAKRTDVNRDAKAKRAQADGIVVPKEVAGEIVDEGSLVDELQRAGEANTLLETRRQNRANTVTAAATLRKDATTAATRGAKVLEEGLAAYNAAIAAAETALTRAKEEAAGWATDANHAAADAKILEKKLADAEPLPEPIDVTMLRQRIDTARATNKAHVDRKQALDRKQMLANEAATLEKQSRDLTASIEARETAKAAGIRTAKMPVDGLGFGDGVVTYNGIPFDQASSAEQLRVSMSIAMAANPKLRVIRIIDGSLLDEDSLAAIGAMAKAEDFQVWIETVSSSGQVGVVIDDGAVASTPESRSGAPAEQAAA